MKDFDHALNSGEVTNHSLQNKMYFKRALVYFNMKNYELPPLFKWLQSKATRRAPASQTLWVPTTPRTSRRSVLLLVARDDVPPVVRADIAQPVNLNFAILVLRHR